MSGKINYIVENNKLHGNFSKHKATKKSVKAYINWGRWVADCPDCNGAEIVSKAEKKLWCLSCNNVYNDGKCYSVTFPKNTEAIEKIILARPNLENRNWEVGETVTELKKQNKVHGDPVEVDDAL